MKVGRVIAIAVYRAWRAVGQHWRSGLLTLLILALATWVVILVTDALNGSG
jgi:hypothetical protein